MKNAQSISTEIISKIIAKKTSLLYLKVEIEKYNVTDQNRKLIYNICYGFFRNYFFLDAVFNEISKKKTKNKVKILLMIGIFQVFFINKAIHAIVNETVKACEMLLIRYAKNFINASLRTLNSSYVLKSKYHELPIWMVDKLHDYYKKDSTDIIQNSNYHAPMFIRINRSSEKQTLKLLNISKIKYNSTVVPNCFILDTPKNVNILPGFNEGLISIQDLSAQYAAHILNPKSNETILDACAAPGGKSSHLVEKCGDIKLTIMDKNYQRLEILKNNLIRLKQNTNNISIICEDAGLYNIKYKEKFDKILLDIPCSSTGVIRRNPDIKLLLNPEEVKKIVLIQQKITNNLLKYLKPKGFMLYVTCSILPEENEFQINEILSMNNNINPVKIKIFDKKYKINHGYQLLPQKNSGDGFYYCLLHKIN